MQCHFGLTLLIFVLLCLAKFGRVVSLVHDDRCGHDKSWWLGPVLTDLGAKARIYHNIVFIDASLDSTQLQIKTTSSVTANGACANTS